MFFAQHFFSHFKGLLTILLRCRISLHNWMQPALAYNIITEDAMAQICRSCEGILRTARNLTLACMIEAIRGRDKIIGIANVNRVLIQPHWRIDRDAEQFL
jgi:hypothetical protein